jgi:hypothetical protein
MISRVYCLHEVKGLGVCEGGGGGRREGGWGLSPKRLCTYSVLSMCVRCPRRERSAHVGASPPVSRSPGCGGGAGGAKGPVAVAPC